MTDEELMALISKKAPGVVESVTQVDPSVQSTPQAQVPPPQPQQATSQQAQPTGIPVIGQALDYAGDTAAGLSRGVAEGVSVTPIKMKVLAMKAMNALGWDNDEDLAAEQKGLENRKQDFLAKEQAMGTPTAGSIGSTLGEIGAGLIPGGAIGLGAKTAVGALKGAGPLLPTLLGQATAAGVQGAISEDQGTLGDSLIEGGRQALLATAGGSIQALGYLRGVRAPGQAKAELSRNAAQGNLLQSKDVKYAKDWARDTLKREAGQERTLAEKFRTSLDNAAAGIEQTKTHLYTKAMKQLDEFGKLDSKAIYGSKAIAKLRADTNAPEAIKFADELDDFMRAGSDTIVDRNPSEVYDFLTKRAASLVKTGDKDVVAAKSAIMKALEQHGDQFTMAGGKKGGDALREAGDYFKKVALPVRKEVKQISKLIEENQIEKAVDVINTSENAGKAMLQIKKHLGADAYEALSDAALAKHYNNAVTGWTIKNGDEISLDGLRKSLLDYKNTTVFKASAQPSKENVELFIDYLTKQKAAPMTKPSSLPGPLKVLSIGKGTGATIASFFTKLLNDSAGRKLLTRAAITPADSIARQRVYLEMSRMLSVANQIEDDLGSRPAEEPSEEDFLKELAELKKGRK